MASLRGDTRRLGLLVDAADLEEAGASLIENRHECLGLALVVQEAKQEGAVGRRATRKLDCTTGRRDGLAFPFFLVAFPSYVGRAHRKSRRSGRGRATDGGSDRWSRSLLARSVVSLRLLTTLRPPAPGSK